MMWLLACSVVVFASFCQAALPVIVNPGQENVERDKITLTWEVSGESTEDYSFEVIVKEYAQALNPHVKGHEVNLPKDRRKTIITDLKSGTTYAASIKTRTDSNTGSPSVKVVFTTKGIKPPRNLEITEITDSSITFEWTPPTETSIDATKIRIKNNDNKIITSYEDQPMPISEYTITGLLPGTPYIVMLQAKSGTELSTTLEKGLRMAVGTIDRVQMTKIEPTTATAEWAAPRLSEGHTVKNYEIVLMKDASDSNTTGTAILETLSTTTASKTSYDLINLTPDRFYAIKVRAVYVKVGKGSFSAPTFFQTIRQERPTTPTKVDVGEVTKKSASITWTKPDYAYKIENYEIEFAKQNTRPEPTMFTNEDNVEAVIGDLESGTNYTARVRAIGQNKIAGVWSVKVVFKTDGPRPVSSVSITEIKDTSAKVSWTTYTGSNADKFVIVYYITQKKTTEKKIEVSGIKSSHVITGLKPTTPYVILVYAMENNDDSTPQKNGLSTNINIDVLTEMPTNVDIKQTSTKSELEVSFDKVPNQLVKFYEVHIQGFNIPNVPFFRKVFWTPKTSNQETKQSGILNDIQSGWKYKVTVRAIYSNDETGRWSTAKAFQISGPRPPRVINIFEITDTSANVHWKSGYEEDDKTDAPNNLQYNVSLYELIGNTNKERFVATHISTSSETSYKFAEGIDATMRYNVHIFSQYKDGSTLIKSTTADLAFRANSARPAAPTIVSRTVRDNTATIFWNRIPNRSDIEYYDVYLIDPSTKTTKQFATKNALEDSYTFTELKKSQFYEFKVRAVVNSDRKGLWLVNSFYVPGAPIKQVENVNVLKKTSNSVTLLWKAGERADLEKYEIELKSQERGITETIVTDGLTNSFKLEDLHPGTLYSYKIRAVSLTNDEKGDWSVSQSFRTADAGPLSGGLSKGIIVGIALAVIAMIVIIIVAVMMCRKRKGQPFEKFDGSVKFQRNSSQDGGLPSQEMDDTATAIRNGKKLYI